MVKSACASNSPPRVANSGGFHCCDPSAARAVHFGNGSALRGRDRNRRLCKSAVTDSRREEAPSCRIVQRMSNYRFRPLSVVRRLWHARYERRIFENEAQW